MADAAPEPVITDSALIDRAHELSVLLLEAAYAPAIDPGLSNLLQEAGTCVLRLTVRLRAARQTTQDIASAGTR